MNRWVYVTIGTAGIVFSLLQYGVADNIQFANTIMFFTIFLFSLLYLIDEIRFYREHRALLASAQFLVIPGLVMIAGNVLGPIGIAGPIVSFTLLDTEVVFTLTSTIAIIPYLFFFALTARYYDERYPGFVFNRNQFGPFVIPFSINILFVSLLILVTQIIGYMDILALAFIGTTFLQLTTKKVLPLFSSPEDDISYEPSERRGFLNSLLGSSSSRSRTTRRPSRRSDQSSSSTTGSTSRSRTRASRSTSSQSSSGSSRSTRRPTRSAGQPVSTAPREGYRDIPTRGRNDRSSRPRPTTTEVNQGKEMVPPTRTVKKRNKKKLSSFLPKGNFTKDDLRCTICYENFNDSPGNVLICPNCKFPAHERELRSWLNQSERCPRCNKDIRGRKELKSSALISEKQYTTIIRKL